MLVRVGADRRHLLAVHDIGYELSLSVVMLHKCVTGIRMGAMGSERRVRRVCEAGLSLP